MALRWVSNLVGTLATYFNIGKAKLVATGLTGKRTLTLPDKDGTLACLSDVGGGGNELLRVTKNIAIPAITAGLNSTPIVTTVTGAKVGDMVYAYPVSGVAVAYVDCKVTATDTVTSTIRAMKSGNRNSVTEDWVFTVIPAIGMSDKQNAVASKNSIQRDVIALTDLAVPVSNWFKVKIPTDWIDTQLTVTIKVQHQNHGEFEFVCYGYLNSISTPQWQNTTVFMKGAASTQGNFNFSVNDIQFGYDGTNPCLILAAQSGAMSVAVTQVEWWTPNPPAPKGWAITRLTALTGITYPNNGIVAKNTLRASPNNVPALLGELIYREGQLGGSVGSLSVSGGTISAPWVVGAGWQGYSANDSALYDMTNAAAGALQQTISGLDPNAYYLLSLDISTSDFGNGSLSVGFAGGRVMGSAVFEANGVDFQTVSMLFEPAGGSSSNLILAPNIYNAIGYIEIRNISLRAYNPSIAPSAYLSSTPDASQGADLIGTELTVAMGLEAGKFHGTSKGVSLGAHAGRATDGVAIGNFAGYSSLGMGGTSVAIGEAAMNGSSAKNTVAIGYYSMPMCGGEKTVAIGANVFITNERYAASCVAVGYGIISVNAAIKNCTLLGAMASVNNPAGTCTNSIAIGYGAAVTASNQTVIGNSNTTETVIYGQPVFPTGSLPSPSFSTQPVDTNTIDGATCEFVLNQAAAATPLALALSGVVGTSTRFARADHVHPIGTADGAKPVPATGTTNNGKVLTAGASAGTFSWQTPAGAVTPSSTTPAMGTVGGTVGVGTNYARNDHAHPVSNIDGAMPVPATSTTNNGKVLTAGATAGSFSWQTPAGGGGLADAPSDGNAYVRKDAAWQIGVGVYTPVSPIAAGWNYCDFLTVAANRVEIGLTTAVISSGTVAQATSTPPDSAHSGVMRITSSTTANSGARCVSDAAAILLKQGMKYHAKIRFTSFTSVSSYFGFHDGTTSTVPTDGAYFSIASSTGVATGVNKSNGTTTTSGTTLTLSLNTWYEFRIEIISATTTRFTIRSDTGTQLWTQDVATNLPTAAGRQVGVGHVSTCSGTTATEMVQIDYIGYLFPSDSGRVVW